MRFTLFGYDVNVQRAPFDYRGWTLRVKHDCGWSGLQCDYVQAVSPDRLITLYGKTVRDTKARVDAEIARPYAVPKPFGYSGGKWRQ